MTEDGAAAVEFAIVATLFFISPILYMVIGSFKPAEEVLNGLAGFIPKNLSLQNYTGVFSRFNSAARIDAAALHAPIRSAIGVAGMAAVGASTPATA